MRKQQSDNGKTNIPTLAEIIDPESEDTVTDDDIQEYLGPEAADEIAEIKIKGLPADFKRTLTRLIYKKLHQQLAENSDRLAMEIMRELQKELSNPKKL